MMSKFWIGAAVAWGIEDEHLKSLIMFEIEYSHLIHLLPYSSLLHI